MKVRALARLSGPKGSQVVGDEFEVSAEQGTDLIGRRLAEEVAAKSPKAKAGDETAAKE